MIYLLDSNSLIDACVKWYPQQVFPKLWQQLLDNKEINIIDEVSQEITYPSFLAKWTQKKYKNNTIFKNEQVIDEYNTILAWIKKCTLWSEAGSSQWSSNSEKADPWLIAFAIAYNCTIVTLDGNGKTNLPDKGAYSSKEPKISSVADYYDVKTIPIYRLLLELNMKFH